MVVDFIKDMHYSQRFSNVMLMKKQMANNECVLTLPTWTKLILKIAFLCFG